eukprot:TRINITY_DN615_c1_g1_i3.p1 TRINITY_DN615_c1_g1~~TRINITY_DN615_c1_g1_i3.p1  ORF type:complete len:2045 (-),score=319.41 TRINITY_DN615_c1_g1_i3:105-5327(-)
MGNLQFRAVRGPVTSVRFPLAQASLDLGGLSIVNLNGDQSSDMMNVVTPSVQAYLGRSSDSWITVLPSLWNPRLAQVYDGLGNFVQFVYAPTSNTSVYTKYNNASFPVVDVQPLSIVVSEVHENDAAGGLLSSSYTYAGRVMVLGLGDLGVASMSHVDQDRGYIFTDFYAHDWQRRIYSQIILSTKTLLFNGVQVEAVASIFNSTSYPASFPPGHPAGLLQRFCISLSSKSTNKYDVDSGEWQSTSTTSYVYDSYNYPTSTTSTITDSIGTASSLNFKQYIHSTSTWILGLITNSTTTKSGCCGSDPITGTDLIAYDLNTGAVTSKTSNAGDWTEITRTSIRDAVGNQIMLSVTGVSFEPYTTQATYDASFRYAMRLSNELGHVSYHEYDAATGATTRTVDPNNLVSSTLYDEIGREISTVRADGVVSRTVFISCDNTSVEALSLISSLGALPLPPCPSLAVYFSVFSDGTGSVAASWADSKGRVIRNAKIDSNGQYKYSDVMIDKYGRDFAVSEPYFEGQEPHWARSQYDALGRTVLVTKPDGSQTQYLYSGLNITSVDPSGARSTRVMDGRGRMLYQIDPLGSITTYEYDSADMEISTTDSLGHSIKYMRDLSGRITDTYHPDSGWTQQRFDAKGNALFTITATGVQVLRYYDVGGRTTRAFTLAPSADFTTVTSANFTWTYDDNARHGGAIGKVSTIEMDQATYTINVRGDSSGNFQTLDTYLAALRKHYSDDKARMVYPTMAIPTTMMQETPTRVISRSERYTYDPAHLNMVSQWTVVINGQSFTMNTTYNDVSLIDTSFYPGGFNITNKYAYGQPISMHDASGSSLWQIIDKDPYGNLLKVLIANGSMTTNYHRDQVTNKLTGVSTTVAADHPPPFFPHRLHDVKFFYDAVYNTKARHYPLINKIECFEYDLNRRMNSSRTCITDPSYIVKSVLDYCVEPTLCSQVDYFVYDAANRILRTSNDTYTYSPSQPHVPISHRSGDDEVTTLTWSASGQMLTDSTGRSVAEYSHGGLPAVIKYSPGANGATTLEYLVHDFVGELFSKTIVTTRRLKQIDTAKVWSGSILIGTAGMMVVVFAAFWAVTALRNSRGRHNNSNDDYSRINTDDEVRSDPPPSAAVVDPIIVADDDDDDDRGQPMRPSTTFFKRGMHRLRSFLFQYKWQVLIIMSLLLVIGTGVTLLATSQHYITQERSVETIYHRSFFEQETTTDFNGSISIVTRYFTGGGSTVYTVNRDGKGGYTYLLRDHQSTVEGIVDSNMQIIQRLSYDAWGARRDPITWDALPDSKETASSSSSSSSDEIDQGWNDNMNVLGLILIGRHRLYNPRLRVVLSADINVPTLPRGDQLNGYAYAANNPITFLDPSGMNIFDDIGNAFKSIGHAIAQFFQSFADAAKMLMQPKMLIEFAVEVAAIAACDGAVVCGEIVSVALAALDTKINGGSWQQALESAALAGVTMAIAGSDLKPLQKVVIDGTLNGADQLAHGGSFALGFAQGAAAVGAASARGAGSIVPQSDASFWDRLMSEKFVFNVIGMEASKITSIASISLAAQLAHNLHMSVDEMDIMLEAVSFVGSYEWRGDGNYEAKGGFWQTPEGPIMQGMMNRGPASIVFDAADVILVAQGLPSATAWKFAVAGKSLDKITGGHSLGAAEVSVLVTYGIIDYPVKLYALPFIMPGGNPLESMYCYRGDPICGTAFLKPILHPSSQLAGSFGFHPSQHDLTNYEQEWGGKQPEPTQLWDL